MNQRTFRHLMKSGRTWAFGTWADLPLGHGACGFTFDCTVDDWMRYFLDTLEQKLRDL